MQRKKTRHEPDTTPPDARSGSAPHTRPPVPLAVAHRLLTTTQAAAYLGISYWTVRHLIDSGKLRRVALPGKDGGPIRRVLLDVRDLDALIERAKDLT